MRNLRLDICYDGTRYRGWQRLPGQADTVQGKIETALSRILGEPVEVSGMDGPMPGSMPWGRWRISIAIAPCR
ncbi:MAG: hypothetical protein II320_02195, partial [Oscillospiraceae bacterium]|nr:hypothetical protein [Oscillospiraceae bacterium]